MYTYKFSYYVCICACVFVCMHVCCLIKLHCFFLYTEEPCVILVWKTQQHVQLKISCIVSRSMSSAEKSKRSGGNVTKSGSHAEGKKARENGLGGIWATAMSQGASQLFCKIIFKTESFLNLHKPRLNGSTDKQSRHVSE